MCGTDEHENVFVNNMLSLPASHKIIPNLECNRAILQNSIHVRHICSELEWAILLHSSLLRPLFHSQALPHLVKLM
jgi:hypothetical protein